MNEHLHSAESKHPDKVRTIEDILTVSSILEEDISFQPDTTLIDRQYVEDHLNQDLQKIQHIQQCLINFEKKLGGRTLEEIEAGAIDELTPEEKEKIIHIIKTTERVIDEFYKKIILYGKEKNTVLEKEFCLQMKEDKKHIQAIIDSINMVLSFL